MSPTRKLFLTFYIVAFAAAAAAGATAATGKHASTRANHLSICRSSRRVQAIRPARRARASSSTLPSSTRASRRAEPTFS